MADTTVVANPALVEIEATASTVAPISLGLSEAEETASETSTAANAAGQAASRARKRPPNLSRAFVKSPPERVFAPTQLLGGFFLRPAFEITEDERQSPFVRQPCQLLVENRSHLYTGDFFFAWTLSNRDSLFVLATGIQLRSGFQCYSTGDAVQPTCEGGLLAHGAEILRQHQESGLKSVLGVSVVVHDSAAHTHDHRAVTSNQGLERGLVSISKKLLDELRVGSVAQRLRDHAPLEVMQERAQAGLGHSYSSHFVSAFTDTTLVP